MSEQYHMNIDMHHLSIADVTKIEKFFKKNGLYWKTDKTANCYYPQNVTIKECPEVYKAGDVQ